MFQPPSVLVADDIATNPASRSASPTHRRSVSTGQNTPSSRFTPSNSRLQSLQSFRKNTVDFTAIKSDAEKEDQPEEVSEKQLSAFTQVLLQKIDVAAGPTKLLWGSKVTVEEFVSSLKHYFTQEGTGPATSVDGNNKGATLLARNVNKSELEMQREIAATRRQITDVKKLEDKLQLLFAAIDDKTVNYITWEQFTSFLIDAETQRKEESLVSMYERVGTVDMHRAWINSAYSSQHPYVLSTTMSQGTVELNVATIEPEMTTVEVSHVFPVQHVVSCLEFLPGTDIFAAACEVAVMFFDAKNAEKSKINWRFTFEDLEDSPSAMKYHPRLNLLFVGCTLGRVVQITPPTWSLKHRNYDPPMILRNFPLGRKTITSIAFLPGLSLYAVGTESAHIHIGNVNRAGLIRDTPIQPHGLRRCVFVVYNDFSNYLVAGGESTDLYMLSATASSGAVPIRLRDVTNPHLCRVVALCTRENSAEMYSIDSKGNVKVWDMSKFTCTQTLSCGDSRAMYTGLHFDYTHRHVIAISRRRIFRFAIEKAVQQKDNVLFLLSVPNSGVVLGITVSNAFVWEARTGTLLVTYLNICPGDISAACIIPPGTTFALGTRVGSVMVFNITTGRKISELLRATQHELTSLHYCPVAQRLVATTLGDEVLYLQTFGDALRAYRVGFETDKSANGVSVVPVVTGNGMSTICVGSTTNKLSWFTFRLPCTVREVTTTDLSSTSSPRTPPSPQQEERDDQIERQVTNVVTLFDSVTSRTQLFVSDTCGTISMVDCTHPFSVTYSWAILDPIIVARNIHTLNTANLTSPSNAAGNNMNTTSPSSPRPMANPSESTDTFLITGLAIYAPSKALYVALETGHVQVYSIEEISSKCLQKERVLPFSGTASSSMWNNASNAFSEDTKDRSAISTPTLLQQWLAHKDSVTTMSLDHHTKLLYTTAQDMSVKVWTLNGDFIANLLNLPTPYLAAHYALEFELVPLPTSVSGQVQKQDVVAPKPLPKATVAQSNSNAAQSKHLAAHNKAVSFAERRRRSSLSQSATDMMKDKLMGVLKTNKLPPVTRARALWTKYAQRLIAIVEDGVYEFPDSKVNSPRRASPRVPSQGTMMMTRKHTVTLMEPNSPAQPTLFKMVSDFQISHVDDNCEIATEVDESTTLRLQGEVAEEVEEEEEVVLWRRSDAAKADQEEKKLNPVGGDTPFTPTHQESRVLYIRSGNDTKLKRSPSKQSSGNQIQLKHIRKLRAQSEWASFCSVSGSALFGYASPELTIKRRGVLRVPLPRGNALTPQPWKIQCVDM